MIAQGTNLKTHLGGGTRRGTVFGIAVVALTLAGCSNTSASKPTTTTTVAPATTTTTSPQTSSAAVLAAFRANNLALLQASEQDNPTYPALLSTETGQALHSDQAILMADKAGGWITKLEGPFNLGSPKVVSLKGTTAVVTSCIQDDGILTSKATGKPAPGISGTFDMAGVRETLSFLGGKWMLVSSTSKTFPYNGGHGTCPGY